MEAGRLGVPDYSQLHRKSDVSTGYMTPFPKHKQRKEREKVKLIYSNQGTEGIHELCAIHSLNWVQMYNTHEVLGIGLKMT